MIDFTRAELTSVITHYVGNKGLGEALTANDKIINIDDDFTKDTFMRYITAPFKQGAFYEFKANNEMNLHNIKDCVQDIFQKPHANFIEQSRLIANHLYNQSMHPKIKGGELYVCYMKDVNCDGVICDAVGIFKTENKDTYLKVFQRTGIDENFDIECDNGINIKKLDKGCIIFNTDQENGYKIALVDANNKIADCAFYWSEDFLNTRIKNDDYKKTIDFIQTVDSFAEEVLTQENNYKKEFKAEVLTSTIKFLNSRENFKVDEYCLEVLQPKKLVGDFKDFRIAYNDKMGIVKVDEFKISDPGVKLYEKLGKMILKLDKNFKLEIAGGYDNILQGYDEERCKKFYTVFYNDAVN